MDKFSKKDIEMYFEDINSRLALQKKHGEIVIAGGAALTLVFDARNSTRDVDAIFRPKEDLRQIILDIAHEQDISEDWLNDGVKGFLNEKMDTVLYKEYSNLQIYSIDAESLLALKLTSARLESTDMADSITLMKHLEIASEVQAFDIIEKYIDKDRQTPQSYYFTKEAFQNYSKEKYSKPRPLSQWKSDIEAVKAQRDIADGDSKLKPPTEKER